MMKYLLVIAVIGVGIFVDVCNAGCKVLLPELRIDGDPGGCIYEEDIHEYGSKWRTEDCQNCACDANGSIECCHAYGTPVNYNKEKCTAIFDKEACVYHVVRKNNQKKTCKHAMVG